MALRALVTGGAGFIGAHLCARLLEEGCEVTALDDLSGGSLREMEALGARARFRFVRRDVCEPFDADVDRVYHLACPASPAQYQADPVRTLKTSVLGTMHALELARRTRARFLLASTSEVYGDPEVHPQPETYWGHVNPVGPRACYDEGKRCAETLTVEHGAHRGVDARIARIFNTYGPGMAEGDGRVVSTFVRQALRGEDLTVHGDGSQTRSFCYVGDMVDGLVRLMEHPDARAPVNLGNPEEVTVADLAARVIAIAGSTSRVVRRALPGDDPKRRCPDVSLARRLLGFEPKVGLSDGLARTVAAARERRARGGDAR